MIPLAPKGKVLAAFLCLYWFWGSTYLGIHYALGSIPPFLAAGLRHTTAGFILFAYLKIRGEPWPGIHDLKRSAVVGLLLLAGGNGGVTWAQQYVPSGLTALVIGSVPLWIAALEGLRPRGKPPNAASAAGLILGFLGLAILLAPGSQTGRPVDAVSTAVLVGACISWAIGTLYSRDTASQSSPLLSTGLSMLAGGLALLVLGLWSGEGLSFQLSAVTPTSWGALVYLIVFGSIVGFSSFIWLLKHASTTKVTTYAYVNPIVAVLLGWFFLHEPITLRVICAAAVIVLSVIIVTLLPNIQKRASQGRTQRHADLTVSEQRAK